MSAALFAASAVLLAGAGAGAAAGCTATIEPRRPHPITTPAPAYRNVAYAAASPAEVLDLWVPRQRPAPVVVYLHSGGFAGGDKREVGPKVRPLLAAGFAVASVNYRLSGEARFPAAPRDVKAAIRFLRANAQRFGLDPGRFVAWGQSAGGDLAALVGTSGSRTTTLDDPASGVQGGSSAVQAVVDWYGPTDLARLASQATTDGSTCTKPVTDQADGYTVAYLGAPAAETPVTAAAADPITYVAKAGTLPAFAIAHGTSDCLIPVGQAKLLAAALTVAGNRPWVSILGGATHGDPRFDAELLAPTIGWLERVLAATA